MAMKEETTGTGTTGTSEGNGQVRVEARRIFELYVDKLTADAEEIGELLLVRLRYFGEDVEQVTKRLAENPGLAVELVHHLSGRMQELDTIVGAAEHGRSTIRSARSVALLLPESAVNE